MHDGNTTREQLIAENAALRQRIAALEAAQTAHKQAEEALRQSEERFRQLVKGSIQGIMIHREGAPVFANQAYAKIYGYDSPEDMLRVKNIFQDVIAPEDRARLEHYFQARLRGEPVPTHYTCGGIRRDGSYIWVENIVTVVTWWGETAIQCTVVDISERKRTEEALRESEERYRTLVEQAADGILISDPDGQYMEVNTSGCAMLGYRREEVISMRVGELSPPEDMEKEPLNLDALHAGLPVVSEQRFRRKDGTLLPVEISAKILSDGRLQSIVRDITARKQAEDTLRDREERFRNLIEGSLQGILIHRDNKPLFVNQAYVDIFGYETPDELYTLETVVSLIAPHERGRLMGYRDARLAGQAVPSHYEYQGLRQDGLRVWLDMTVRVVSWDGQPAIQSIVADISERKQTEEALLHAERLASLGTLAAGIAHELNNPLGAITVTAEHARQALTGHAIPEGIRDCLDDILNDANRCAQTVKRTLECAREGYPVKTVVDLHPIIETACTITQSYAIHHGMPLALILAPTSVRIRANVEEIKLALVNLIRNAVEAGQNGAQVSLRTEVEAAQVLITVQDTGVGLTEEGQQYAFDPFYTTRQNAGGTGLGLSITHRIITNHEGTIELCSRSGQGTLVHIRLPLVT